MQVAVLVLSVLVSPCFARHMLQPNVSDVSWKEERMKFAAHVVGVNMAFMEAQRAGRPAADSASLFPTVWAWKQPGYTNMCTKALQMYDGGDGEASNLNDYAGYFEAGNAVLVTGVLAFTAVQEAIGALNFMPELAANTPMSSLLADPKGCLAGGYVQQSLKDTYMRQMRYTAWSLDQSILYHDDNGTDYVQLVGVADSSTYGKLSPPSWETPASYQEICYIGDMENPVADIAAQTAAGLALSAKMLMEHGLEERDKVAAWQWWKKAKAAYTYAQKMAAMHGDAATCSASSAVSNCIGMGCLTSDEYGQEIRGTCKLYNNEKPPAQHLFVAAAAMFLLTGNPTYKADADALWDDTWLTFLFNWNNVVAQGVVLMSMAPEAPGGQLPRAFYHAKLKEAALYWSECSNEGEAGMPGYTFCKKTPDGSAYTLDFPWGNTGSILNGVCLSAVYHKLAIDPLNSVDRHVNLCFMQRQLGYFFNHKCETQGSMCNTPTEEGFSYMVGVGNYYPQHLHSRDAAYPLFRTHSPDPNMLCGALVSGPYAPTALHGPHAEDGPVPEGTDLFTDNRRLWRETEPAVDYTGGLICAMMGYASQPDGVFHGCDCRTPFTGRGA